MTTSQRLTPLSGLAGIACIVGGLAADAAPTSSWPDARITGWYATHGMTHWLLSACLLALGAPFLLIFTADLAARLADRGAGRRATAVVAGAGITWATTILVGAALYAAVAAAITFAQAPAPSPDISRYFLGSAYGVLVMFSAFAAALLAAALSLTALRCRTLPRWLAAAGIPASILMLANAWLPMAAITLWFAATSITLTVAHRAPASRISQPAMATAI